MYYVNSSAQTYGYSQNGYDKKEIPRDTKKTTEKKDKKKNKKQLITCLNDQHF